jgi:hypothetical protein
MPPKNAPAPPPARGSWAASGVNHLSFALGGNANSSYATAAADIQNVAHGLLTRTHPGAVVPVINVAGPINMNDYQVWYILDRDVASELRRVLSMASVRIA